jgi:hypothetical protein
MSYATTIAAAAPAHWWRFAEAAGATTFAPTAGARSLGVHYAADVAAAQPSLMTLDAAAKSVAVVNRGAAPYDRGLYASGALSQLPGNGDVGSISVEFWYRVTTALGYYATFFTVSNGPNGENGFTIQLQQTSTGQQMLTTFCPSTYSERGGVGAPNTPHMRERATAYHYVVTYDFAAKRGRIYQNGVEISTVAGTHANLVATEVLHVNSDGCYVGDLAIYFRELSAAEALDHFRQGAGDGSTDFATAVLADAPRAWYRRDEAQDATVAIDSSGNGRDGTQFGPVDGRPEARVPGATAGDNNRAIVHGSRAAHSTSDDYLAAPGSAVDVGAGVALSIGAFIDWDEANVAPLADPPYQSGMMQRVWSIRDAAGWEVALTMYHNGGGITVWRQDPDGNVTDILPGGRFGGMRGYWYVGVVLRTAGNGARIALQPWPRTGPAASPIIADLSAGYNTNAGTFRTPGAPVAFDVGRGVTPTVNPDGFDPSDVIPLELFTGIVDEVAVFSGVLSDERMAVHVDAARTAGGAGVEPGVVVIAPAAAATLVFTAAPVQLDTTPNSVPLNSVGTISFDAAPASMDTSPVFFAAGSISLAAAAADLTVDPSLATDPELPSIVFSSSAVLTVDVALESSGGITFDGSAALSNPVVLTPDGPATISFSDGAALAVDLVLAPLPEIPSLCLCGFAALDEFMIESRDSITFGGSAGLTVDVGLESTSGSIVFGGSADLAGSGSMENDHSAGPDLALVAAPAPLVIEVALASSGSIVFGGSADLSGTGAAGGVNPWFFRDKVLRLRQ